MAKRRCARCGAELHAGAYYDVTIELKSDAEPIQFNKGDLRRDTQQAIDDLVEQLRDADPKQLEEDVYKLFEFKICRGCQQVLLHDPLQRSSITAAEWPEFDVDDFLDSLKDEYLEDHDEE